MSGARSVWLLQYSSRLHSAEASGIFVNVEVSFFAARFRNCARSSRRRRSSPWRKMWPNYAEWSTRMRFNFFQVFKNYFIITSPSQSWNWLWRWLSFYFENCRKKWRLGLCIGLSNGHIGFSNDGLRNPLKSVRISLRKKFTYLPISSGKGSTARGGANARTADRTEETTELRQCETQRRECNLFSTDSVAGHGTPRGQRR